MRRPGEDTTVGLCASCRHSRRITSGKGSTFWYCRLAESNPRFPKYPSLPVLRCDGYIRLVPPVSGPDA
jgi:hypothetical protein